MCQASIFTVWLSLSCLPGEQRGVMLFFFYSMIELKPVILGNEVSQRGICEQNQSCLMNWGGGILCQPMPLLWAYCLSIAAIQGQLSPIFVLRFAHCVVPLLKSSILHFSTSLSSPVAAESLPYQQGLGLAHFPGFRVCLIACVGQFLAREVYILHLLTSAAQISCLSRWT